MWHESRSRPVMAGRPGGGCLDQFAGAPGTLELYRGHVRNHISPRLGRYKVGQIDAEMLDSFYGELRRCRSRCDGRRRASDRAPHQRGAQVQGAVSPAPMPAGRAAGERGPVLRRWSTKGELDWGSRVDLRFVQEVRTGGAAGGGAVQMRHPLAMMPRIPCGAGIRGISPGGTAGVLSSSRTAGGGSSGWRCRCRGGCAR
jgi:hypothetical protein